MKSPLFLLTVNSTLLYTPNVNPDLSVEEAHKIAEVIEKRVQAEIKPLANVTVHVEPSGVAFSAMEVDEAHLKKAVYEVAKNIAGYLRINRIVTYAADGKRYINIDCCLSNRFR